MKLDYKKTFLIGLGFFTVNIIWSLYNVKVPLYLAELGLSGMIVGMVMALDNVFAVVFQPIFGALSDKTNTRYGRRMPYLLIGIPLSAVFFSLIPFTGNRLVPLMISVIGLNFFMSVYRAPTVALMPDVTPSPLRSKANGIINFMGGLGTAIAFLLGGFLFRINDYLPFFSGSIILMLTIIIMYNFVKEPEQPADDGPASEKPEENGERQNEEGRLLSLIFILLAIFFWYASWNAVETFFSTYGEKVLGIDESLASFLLLTVSAFFLIFAIPAGFIAGRIGRKNTILAGIIGLTLAFVCLIFIRNVTVMFVLMAVGGISWAFININSYPMVVEMTSSKGIGKYTGYYYFFSMLASIISPILFGYLKDILGDEFLFIYAGIALVIAFFFMMLVKHGEPKAKTRSAFEEIEHMDY